MEAVRARWLAPAAVFVVAAIVYRLTALSGVGFWDTAEYQTVARVLGIAHAPGYPTFTLLGHLATWWPEGSVAWRMNLFGGLCGAGAAAVLVAVAMRLGAGAVVAAGAALAFAFHRPFWETANRADPFPLHVAFVLVAFWLALGWQKEPRPWKLGALAAVAGLALGNHMQFSMVVPALALFVFSSGPKRLIDARMLGAAAAGALAGLSVFAYLPVRAAMSPPLNYMDPRTPERFWALVSAAQFRDDMAFLSLQGLQAFLVKAYQLPAMYAAWAPQPALAAVVALAAVGLAALARRNWQATLALVLAAFLPLYAALNYVNPELQRYFFVPSAIACLLAALGAQAALDALKRLGPPPAVAVALAFALMVAPLAQLRHNWPDPATRAAEEAAPVIARLLERLEPNALVLATWNVATPLWYARFVEGRRPDVLTVDARYLIDHGWQSEPNTIRMHLPQRPVYLLDEASVVRGMAQGFRAEFLGPIGYRGVELVRVLPAVR